MKDDHTGWLLPIWITLLFIMIFVSLAAKHLGHIAETLDEACGVEQVEGEG